MTGIIYRPDVPQPHLSLVLTGYSSRFTYELQETILQRVGENGVDTLEIIIEENSMDGRLIMAERLMLTPLDEHWHTIRFGDITRRQTGELCNKMLAVRLKVLCITL